MNIRDNHRDFFLLVYPIIKLIVRNTRTVSWRVVRAGFVLLDTPAWEASWRWFCGGKGSGWWGRARLEETPGKHLVQPPPSQSRANLSARSGLWRQIQNNANWCFILPWCLFLSQIVWLWTAATECFPNLPLDIRACFGSRHQRKFDLKRYKKMGDSAELRHSYQYLEAQTSFWFYSYFWKTSPRNWNALVESNVSMLLLEEMPPWLFAGMC